VHDGVKALQLSGIELASVWIPMHVAGATRAT